MGHPSTSEAVTCAACGAGKFAPAAAATCTACSGGKYTSAASESCTECKTGQPSLLYGGTANGEICVCGRLSQLALKPATAAAQVDSPFKPALIAPYALQGEPQPPMPFALKPMDLASLRQRPLQPPPRALGGVARRPAKAVRNAGHGGLQCCVAALLTTKVVISAFAPARSFACISFGADGFSVHAGANDTHVARGVHYSGVTYAKPVDVANFASATSDAGTACSGGM